jgi:hypothetical protein
MPLTDLWVHSRNQLENKLVQQIIAFAGTGQLRDGNAASAEFRDFLSQVPSHLLRRYVDQCLQDGFSGSGFALQDIINEVGCRLGFQVIHGRYRGSPGHIGHDGLWLFPEGHTVMVEVKTTDTYRIDLDTLAGYRRALIQGNSIGEERSSILIVVGREDTGDLEAQIRGSRHAWDMRLISVDALMRLMVLKEEVEDPQIIRRIYAILIPREFTKLDEIIEILLSTAEEVKPEELKDGGHDEEIRVPAFTPVAFHEACIPHLEQYLHCSLLKRSRSSYSSPDGSFALICAISKAYERRGQVWFWYAFHPHQKEFLAQTQESFIAFGCGSEEILLLIPTVEFVTWLDGMNMTQRGDRFYWHVHISKEADRLMLHRKKGFKPIELTKFVVPRAPNDS